MPPLLSVAVVVYNQEKYISQTLDSIIDQEHDYPYEIVIGDDCSTDDTRNILQKYREKHPETIKLLLNEKNTGLKKNTYNVYGNCSGKYIMQCDGDDYWLPGKINIQISFMENNPLAGMCCGQALFLYGNNRFVSNPFRGKITFNELIAGNPIPALTACFRNILLQKYIEEINPLEKNWLTEDYPVWLWLAHNSKIVFLDNNFGVHRCLQGTLSRPKNLQKFEQFTVSTYDIKYFFLSLYNIPHLKEELENEKMKLLASYAALNRQYYFYKKYISGVSGSEFKTQVKRIFGLWICLFNIYWFYLKLKSLLIN